MNNRRTMMIAAGVLGAFAVFSFVLLALSSRHVSAQPMRSVVVSLRSIPPRSRLTLAMFVVTQRPADQVQAGTLSSLDGVEGSVSERAIPQGTPVTAADIAPVSTLGLAVALHAGMRAVSIAVDPVKDVSDLLQPGDRVDVISAPPRTGNEPMAATIIRDVTVLSVGSMFANPPPAASGNAAGANAPAPVRTVTLEVTPAQADLLTMADLNTTLRLALRPPNEPQSSAPLEHVVFSTPQPQQVVAMPSHAAPPRRVKMPSGIPVIEGDKLSNAAE